jgi:hypothetical protein
MAVKAVVEMVQIQEVTDRVTQAVVVEVQQYIQDHQEEEMVVRE